MDIESAQRPLGDWDFWTQGLDRTFFQRVYVRAIQISAVVALLFLAFEQKSVSAGILCGATVGLFSTWTIEATVRLLFKGGKFAGLKLAIAAFVKLPFMLAGLTGIAWAGDRGILNIFAVIGGVLLVHAALLVMVIASALAAEDRVKERYR